MRLNVGQVNFRLEELGVLIRVEVTLAIAGSFVMLSDTWLAVQSAEHAVQLQAHVTGRLHVKIWRVVLRQGHAAC